MGPLTLAVDTKTSSKPHFSLLHQSMLKKIAPYDVMRILFGGSWWWNNNVKGVFILDWLEKSSWCLTVKLLRYLFGVYEPTKQKLLNDVFLKILSAVAHLTAGVAVGGICCFLSFVFQQRDMDLFLLRDLPFDAIQFSIYEQLRIGYRVAAQRELNDPEECCDWCFCWLIISPDMLNCLHFLHMILIFSLNLGALTGAITTPLDVIKTRLTGSGISLTQY
ncbi:hypothetical protein NC651_013007 [Populus alba x Populus x berolinensis]|nr:hypothetical protein NC651_013007 [Populus alba x Populus x berolinensis]